MMQLVERRSTDELDEGDRMKSLINGLVQCSRVGRKEGESGKLRLEVILNHVLEGLGGYRRGSCPSLRQPRAAATHAPEPGGERADPPQ